VLRIDWDASNWAHLDTLRFIKVAHAFCALVGVDFIDLWAKVDRLIGTFRFTHIAIDAFVGDHQGHRILT
jgi:hypothetical protein